MISRGSFWDGLTLILLSFNFVPRTSPCVLLSVFKLFNNFSDFLVETSYLLIWLSKFDFVLLFFKVFKKLLSLLLPKMLLISFSLSFSKFLFVSLIGLIGSI